MMLHFKSANPSGVAHLLTLGRLAISSFVRLSGVSGSAPGLTGILVGMKALQQKESESILAPSLAASIVRCRLKRR